MFNRGPSSADPSGLPSKTQISAAVKITGIYFIFGCLWIFYSDQLLTVVLDRELDVITQLQTLKGWLYVVVTAGMLWGLIRRETRVNQQINRKLKNTLIELQTAQSALQESQEQFAVFMTHSPAAAWVTDVAGRVEYVSQGYTRMFQAPADLLGQNVVDIYANDIAQAYLENIQTVAHTGQVLQVVEPGIREDGSLGQFLVCKFPLPQPDGSNHVGGVAIDVTQWKQAEVALQASEEQLRLALDFSQIGTWDWNLKTNELVWDDTHFELLGLNPETVEASYRNWSDRIHPDDLPRLELAVSNALNHASTYEEEYRVIRPDGNVRWLMGKGRAIYDADGQPTRMIGGLLDITDRKQTEELLRLREQQFRQAILNAPYPALLHAEDGAVIEVNQVWTELTGYEAADIPTIATWVEKAYGQQMDIVQEKIERLYASDKRVYEGEFTPRTKDGQERVWDFSSAPVGQLPDGRRLVLSMAADITQRKWLERALRRQAERLELTSAIAQRIRQSLNLNEILNTTVVEVKYLLRVDRVIIYQFSADWSGTIVAESVSEEWPPLLGTRITDTYFQTDAVDVYLRGQKRAIADIYEEELTDCHLHLLEQFDVKANLAVPIVLMGAGEEMPTLWGLLIAHQCAAPREWHAEQLDLLEQIALQMAIAIQQAQIYEQAQRELLERQQAEMHLRAALAEKEVLLKEIHHRVKNNLQIVSGLLQLQAQGLSDPDIVQALRESQNRIESMSLIHKKLYRSSDLEQVDVADYIQSLAVSLLTTYQISPGAVALRVDVDPVTLNLDQAIPCGLIINELVSNALKYAFTDNVSGEITIKLCQANDQVELTIQDNGRGLPKSLNWQEQNWQDVQSLGLSLVHALATEQLDGSLTVDHRCGTTFTIRFPQFLSKK